MDSDPLGRGDLIEVDFSLAGNRGWGRILLGRNKFYHFRSWYRCRLAPSVLALAAEGSGGHGYFESDLLRRLAVEHRDGVANHTLDLHKCLAVGCMSRLLKGL